MGNEMDLSRVVFQLAIDAESASAGRPVEVPKNERVKFCTLWKLRILGYLEHLSWLEKKGFDISWLGEKNKHGESIVDDEVFKRFVAGDACLQPQTLDALVDEFGFKSRAAFMQGCLEFLPSDRDAQEKVYKRIVERLEENLAHLDQG